MRGVIGVRRESATPWERRVPLSPDTIQRLVRDKGVSILVQPSARRVFLDKEFVRAGATVTPDLADAAIVLGISEIAPAQVVAGAVYMCFAEVVKGQAHNLPALRRLLELGCTLIDYERITDDQGRRLVTFDRFAGIAGMIDSLWALGERLAAAGVKTPFATIQPTHTYDSLHQAKAAVAAAGQRIARQGLPAAVTPLVLGIVGAGRMATGVREVLAQLPSREVEPAEVASLSTSGSVAATCVYHATFREHDVVESTIGAATFDLAHYAAHPQLYRSCFAPYLPYLSVLMNCASWDPRSPRLVHRADLTELYGPSGRAKLEVIGDLAGAVEGAIECTVRATNPGSPVYMWDARDSCERPGFSGPGPVILAVDILPAELPREASDEFSTSLHRFVPALARADYALSFAALDLPAELKRAVIVHRGELTPDYRYLAEHLQ